MLLYIRRLIGLSGAYPPEHQRNFTNLYFDMVWWGVINGTTLSFIVIYMSRLGATTLQVGLMVSIPALVNTLVTLPANRFLQGHPTFKALRWSSLAWRIFYALLIPLPLLFTPRAQVWTILAVTFIMNIPATAAVVMGNTFFAEVVPADYRGQVAGLRNGLLSLTTMVSTLVAGQILTRLSFERGYQVVFAIGFLGGMMSLLHLWRVRPVKPRKPTRPPERSLQPRGTLRLDVVRGPFGKVLLLVFLLYMAVLLTGPILPLYQVNVLRQTDAIIGIGGSIYSFIQLMGSTQTGLISRRIGFRRMTGIGAVLVSTIMVIFIFSFQPGVFYFGQVISGAGWALINVGLVNYVLENSPEDDRLSHLAWFNLAMNIATLLSGLAAPQIANLIGLAGTMAVSAGLRFIAALAILGWGARKGLQLLPGQAKSAAD